jgi:5-methylcytosine-specific restriction endonuclease McrA
MLKPCADCGKLSHGTRCPECAGVSARRANVAKNARSRRQNWTWPGYQKMRQRVLKRDGGCVKCGDTKNLSLHHLTYDPELERDPDNYVTLCSSCHGVVDGRRAHAGAT